MEYGDYRNAPRVDNTGLGTLTLIFATLVGGMLSIGFFNKETDRAAPEPTAISSSKSATAPIPTPHP